MIEGYSQKKYLTKIRLKENASCENCRWKSDYSDNLIKEFLCQVRGFRPATLPNERLCMYWTKKYEGVYNPPTKGWALNNINNRLNPPAKYKIYDFGLKKGKIYWPYKDNGND